MADTIVALGTPHGRSGIGVIRLSGDGVLSILRSLVGDGDFAPRSRVAHLRSVRDLAGGDVVDEAIVTFFERPRSFTGEDVAEIACHGSPVILRSVIDSCLYLGARLAEPGEFTLRALSNGRMNLSQAEAVRDIIEARSMTAVRQSVRQLKGQLSLELQPLKDALLDCIVVLESAVEFVEDDLPSIELESLQLRIELLAAQIAALAGTFKSGHLLRDGFTIAIIGRPNVGKSSLFNALVGRDRSIVTEIAGTTRDQVHESLLIGDVPVRLVDTAGVRETLDTVESIGVSRSRGAMFEADVVLLVLDGSTALTSEDLSLLKEAEHLNCVVVLNKSDLGSVAHLEGTDALCVSAKAGINLDDLRKSLIARMSGDEIGSGAFLISDARHFDLLIRAESELRESLRLLQLGTSEEIVLVGLHNAMRFLGEITGEVTTEDMLTRIFSTFCIGK